MPIPEETVQSVVSDVSTRLQDPNYTQVALGTLIQAHPDVGRFLSAQTEKLGGGEQVVHAAFHAQLLVDCVTREAGAEPAPITFAKLDEVSGADARGRLTEKEPALASYIASNVDEEPVREVLALIALAMVA